MIPTFGKKLTAKTIKRATVSMVSSLARTTPKFVSFKHRMALISYQAVKLNRVKIIKKHSFVSYMKN